MEAALTNPSGRMTLGSSVVRIGSAQDNHVVINDPRVSLHHAEIRPEGYEEYTHTIIDLGSTAGTFVNERRLDYKVPSLLRPNDTIRIGDAVFNYEVTGAPFGGEPDQLPMAARESEGAPRLHGPPDSAEPFRALEEETPQRGTLPYGGPGQVSAAGASPFGVDPSLPHGRPQGPPPHYPATPTPTYSERAGSAHGPYAAFATPPTGGMAPVSPPGSPTYTVASLFEKDNRRKLWLAGGLTLLVILLVALLFGIFHSPGRTLDTFCSASQSGDYQTAYNQLSPGLQGTVTESQFAFLLKSKTITSCTHSSPNVSGNSAVATIITNSGPASAVWLIQDSSFNWRIDSLFGL